MQALIGVKVSEMIEPPRSWGHAEKLAFLSLPSDLQRFYVKREAERDREVRRCQNELARARKALAEVQQELEVARMATRKPDERHEDQQIHDRAH
jgi:hypothetical protein